MPGQLMQHSSPRAVGLAVLLPHPAQRTRLLYAFLGARTGEVPGAWLGRPLEDWAESAGAGPELVAAIRELLALSARLEVGAWSRGSAAEVDNRELLRSADRVLGAGL